MKKSSIWKSALWYFFCIITIVQIVAMGFYFTKQFGSVTLYESTMEYIEIAKSLQTDEYMGLLYPLLLRLAMWMENALVIKYYQIVYVVQLVCAITAIAHFVNGYLKFENNRWRYFTVVGFLTSVPMLASMYTVLQPVTLQLALWLLVLVSVKRLREDPDNSKYSCFIFFGSIGLILLVPKDFYVLLMVYAVLTVSSFVQKRCWKRVLVLSLFFLVWATVSVEIMQEGVGRGRMERSFSSVWFLECTSPHFAKDYVCYPEEVRAVIPFEEAVLLVRRDDGMLKGIEESLLDVYGRKNTNDFYRQMGNTAFRMHTKETVYSLRDDVLQGIFTPFSIMKHKNSGYNSKDGYWYSNFPDGFGDNGKYVYFGSIIVLFLLLGLKAIEKMLKGIKEKGVKSVLRGPGTLIAVGILQVIISAWLDVGAMDYVNYPIMIFVWYFMAVVI